MHNFNKIQMQILDAMLKREIFLTYKFVKNQIQSNKSSSSYLWESILKLEKQGLIKRINNASSRKIKHERLFNKKLLEKKYNLQFNILNGEFYTTTTKEILSLDDTKKIILDSQNKVIHEGVKTTV